MSNRLCFALKLKPHPFPYDPTSRLEAWGQFAIRLETPDAVLHLFEWEWNLDDLAQWFVEEWVHLCAETLPQAVPGCIPQPHESLAQALDRCYTLPDPATDFAEDDTWDSWFEALRLYRQGHALRRALPGARVPDIVIGLNRGEGEISLNTITDEHLDGAGWEPQYKGVWAYSFDMTDFCQHLHQTLRQTLAEWERASNDVAVQSFAMQLLARLEATGAPHDPASIKESH